MNAEMIAWFNENIPLIEEAVEKTQIFVTEHGGHDCRYQNCVNQMREHLNSLLALQEAANVVKVIIL